MPYVIPHESTGVYAYVVYIIATTAGSFLPLYVSDACLDTLK